MAASVLNYIYDYFSEELFRLSWLSPLFPALIFPPQITQQQKTGIQRGTRMITEVLSPKFGEDLPRVKASLSLITLASSGKNLCCCELPDSVSAFI